MSNENVSVIQYFNTVKRSIDQRIEALRGEEKEILQICHQLSQFVQQNSLTPYNDEIMEYIRYFIQEEETKKAAGAQNQEVIQGLRRMIEKYENEQRLHGRVSAASNTNEQNSFVVEDVFGLVARLYKLPIHGRSIKEQVEGLKRLQSRGVEEKESLVQMPFNANPSKTMTQLKQIVSPTY